jgi:protein O-mannosyl-transferase
MAQIKKFLNNNKTIIHTFILIVLVGFVFAKTRNFGLLNWDDDQNFIKNLAVKNFDLTTIWTQAYFGMFIPITYSAWALLTKFTSDTSVFHTFNLTIHLANCVLVYALLKHFNQKQSTLPVLLAALFFGLHPLQTEAISWATGGKDLLSAFFALASLLIYSRSSSAKAYTSALALLTLAVLSKPSAAALPVVLLCYDLFIEKRKLKASLLKLLPFFTISAAIIYITQILQGPLSEQSLSPLSFIQKTQVAVQSLAFYIIKLELPFNMTPDYGLTPDFLLKNFTFLTSLSYFILFSGIMIYAFFRAEKVIFLGILIFLVGLLPTLGFVPFSFQTISNVADRYIYFSLFGASLLLSRLPSRKIINSIFIFILAFYGFLAFQQTEIWRSDQTLFTHMIDLNKNSSPANTGLGVIALGNKNYAEAENYFKTAISNNPDNAMAQSNLYITLDQQGKFTEVQLLSQNLFSDEAFLKRNFGTEALSFAYTTAAFADFKLNDFDTSFARLCKALFHYPENIDARSNMSVIRQMIKLRDQKEPTCTQ